MKNYLTLSGLGKVLSGIKSYVDKVHTTITGEITTQVNSLKTLIIPTGAPVTLDSSIASGKYYYNDTSGKTISSFSGFDKDGSSCAIVVSTYPITFSGSNIRKAQYIEYLVTESGYYIYTFDRVPISASDYIICVGCCMYEE